MKILRKAALILALALAALVLVGGPAQATKGHTITICHKPGTPAEKTKDIPREAWSEHKGHGDYKGECKPKPTPSPTEEPTPEPTVDPTPDPEPTVDPTPDPEPTVDPTPEPTDEPSPTEEPPTTIGTPLTPEDDAPEPVKRTTHSERELAETGKKEEGLLVAGAIGITLLGIGTAATLYARSRKDRDG